MKTCRASLLLLAVSTICAATASAATLYWKGPGNANAVANWCTDAELTVAATAVPVDGDDIILGTGAGDMTWNLNDVTPGSWTQTADYAGTVTFNTGRRNGIPTSTALKVGGTTVYLCGVTEDGGLTRTFKVSGNCSLLGGVWTHSAQPTKTSNFTSYAASSSGLGVFRILADIGGNLDIGAAFSMDVTGKGFDLNARGPGGNGGNNDSANHAGVGGKNANKATKNCYGRFRMPNTIGSAGGSTGGGAIEITVAGALTMASGATLKANGTNVSYYAGAGGSISIVAGSISGAGSLAANGGATTSDSGGGGGGGRISIVLTGAGQDFTGFSGTYSTVESHQFGKTTGNDGFGGTTYLETAADGVGGGILMVDGSKQFHSRGRLRNYGTPITADECAYNLKKIVLRDGARLVIPQNVTYSVPPIEAATPNNAETNYIAVYNNTLVFADVNRTISGPCGITTYNSDSSVVNVIKMGASGTGTLTLASEGSLQIDSQTTLMGSLVVANGGIATHSTGGTSATYMLNLTVTGNVTVNSGGAISATGKGYTTAVGKGSSGNSKNAGGMHAGRINDNGQHKTKHCYGSIRRPVAYGSGGSGTGCNGGGAINLVVGGTLVNNGTIEANGATIARYSGAGGSVWVVAGTLSGSGSFKANGGLCTASNSSQGGPGSGGRVSIWLTGPTADFSLFTGAATAYGGYNASNGAGYIGGAGTVYLKNGAQAENGGTLIIRGERNSNYQTEIYTQSTDAVTDTDVGDVLIDTYGKLLLTNVTMTVAGSWTNNNVLTAALDSFVEFTDASRVAHITGNNAFRSIVCTTPGKVIRFPASGTSVGAAGYFTIAGAQGNPVVLREENNGPWTFSVNASAMTDVEYVDVANCDASGGQTIVARNSAASAEQNNTNWNFPSIEPGQTITWTGATSSNWADPGNWDLERVPVETDRAVIPALGPGADMPSFSGVDVQLCDLTVASGATLSLAGLNLTVTNATTVAGSIVCSGSETITCLGNVNLAGATIVPSHSDFRIAGDLVQTANLGSLSFWNVTISKSGGSLSFAGGFTVQNRLEVSSSAQCGISFASGAGVNCQYTLISGPAGGGLVLSGSGWNLNVAAYASVENCSVGGCTAGGIKIYPAPSCTDLGSNVNWAFGTGIVRWTGGAGTTSFADGENWSSGSVPGENDRVAIDSAVTVAVSESVSVKSIDLGGGENAAGLRVRAPLEVAEYVNVLTNGTLTADDVCTIGECLAVMNGGVLTHTANTSAGLYKMDIACGQLYVEEGGAVSAKGKGFPTGYGPGGGGYNQAGSYGGHGVPQTSPSSCYGSIFEPVDLGSGGCYANAAGGGAIKIFADGEMRIDGSVNASGQDGAEHYAGSGGSVYLSSSVLTGTGTVRAEGGSPGSLSAGGGGRIALYETSAVDFSRWNGTAYAAGGKLNGDAGTVYMQTASDGLRGGEIIVSNRTGSRNFGTPVPATKGEHADPVRNFSLARIVARDNSRVVISADMKVRDVSILSSGSDLYCTNHTLRIVSREHKDGHGWAKQATTSPAGSIVWASGFAVSVR